MDTAAVYQIGADAALRAWIAMQQEAQEHGWSLSGSHPALPGHRLTLDDKGNWSHHDERGDLVGAGSGATAFDQHMANKFPQVGVDMGSADSYDSKNKARRGPR